MSDLELIRGLAKELHENDRDTESDPTWEEISELDRSDFRCQATTAISWLRSKGFALRDEVLELAAKVADEADKQDERDNGMAMTGAARTAANNIRSLKAEAPQQSEDPPGSLK